GDEASSAQLGGLTTSAQVLKLASAPWLPWYCQGCFCFPSFCMDSYSQYGEDVLLWHYFGEKKNGFFVEAGANHPTKCSQTWLFEQNGWKGILVEPIPRNCEVL